VNRATTALIAAVRSFSAGVLNIFLNDTQRVGGSWSHWWNDTPATIGQFQIFSSEKSPEDASSFKPVVQALPSASAVPELLRGQVVIGACKQRDKRHSPVPTKPSGAVPSVILCCSKTRG
jgi:hypothetical protein